jgi:hypothetical protein
MSKYSDSISFTTRRPARAPGWLARITIGLVMCLAAGTASAYNISTIAVTSGDSTTSAAPVSLGGLAQGLYEAEVQTFGQSYLGVVTPWDSDGLAFTVPPEPSTALLLAFGLGFAAAINRKAV